LPGTAGATKPKPPSLFITGTDTGVGKTILSALIGLIYKATGLTVGYLKPVETGAVSVNGELVPPDASFLARVLGLEDEPLEMLCPYRFELPASPHLAARLAGKRIKPDVIRECFNYFDRRYDTVIVEGAGGLFVPLKSEYLVADLARDLKLPLVIAARPGLGTINHTLLTIAAALRAGLAVAGVIINRYPVDPDPVVKDNPKAITFFSGVPVLALVPEIAGLEKREPVLRLIEEAAAKVEETYRLSVALARRAVQEENPGGPL